MNKFRQAFDSYVYAGYIINQHALKLVNVEKNTEAVQPCGYIFSILLSVCVLHATCIRTRRINLKKNKMQNMSYGRFLCAGAFLRERTGIIVFCIVCTFASVLFALFPICRTLVLVFHHPYIDSTLSDTLYCVYIRT